MEENKNTNHNQEKDFVSSTTFQKTVRKSKWKQVSLYIFISILTFSVFFILIQAGTNNLINKKMDQDMSKITQEYLSGGKGAGIVDFDVKYTHGFLSTEAEITYYKKIGDRLIPWEVVTKEYPAFGKVKETTPTRVESYIVGKNERTVLYNHLNNERRINFYYPHIGYHILPQELEIATGLDENTLIEVALSFEESMKLKDVGEILGSKNVHWLWEDKSKANHFNELNESEVDFDHVLHGEDAHGFRIYQDSPIWEAENLDKQTLISGAIVIGIPSELKRFLGLEIIRASVIGVTMDNY
ncbi:anti sigma factor C-terminal domain-containing protein [Ornithinibacillus scapharcae]|uniref:anti sigma factor C-terminal domain-containing protein n=1 Tax=Ornithinibacillus scapharcae TaxID=1147159 RepID=UPI000225B001|nr:anti sigma factor C-terminal domain-containing protein [Ornithinibacillus scapharcae]